MRPAGEAAILKGGLQSAPEAAARVRTAGEQADIEHRLVAQLRGVVAEHGFGTAQPHAFVPEPAEQPKQFTMTLEGVPAEVTGQKTAG